MTFYHKILAFCLSFLLATFGVVVEAGGNHHGRGHEALAALLATGVIAQLLRGGGGGGGEGRHAAIHEHSGRHGPVIIHSSKHPTSRSAFGGIEFDIEPRNVRY